MQVLALEIFDHSDHGAVLVNRRIHDDRADFCPAEKLTCSVAAFSSNNFIVISRLTDINRLDQAVFLNGIGKFY